MLEKLLVLQSYGFYEGGALGSFLDKLSQAGFFSYLLPFLLIFALVYGILLRLDFFKGNKSVNGIIALAVGLLALQFEFVPLFFSEVFPRVGIGLAIILVILILMGLFMPKANWVTYVLFGVSALIVIIILIQSGGYFGSDIGYWFSYNWPWIAGVVFMIIVISIIVNAGSEKAPTQFEEIASPILRNLFGVK